jgi:hypothetical protein
MSNTYTQIQKLSNERQHLFELGGVQSLSSEQRKRLDEITGRLPGLWEEYRRELVAPVPSQLTRNETLQRAMVDRWEHGASTDHRDW